MIDVDRSELSKLYPTPHYKKIASNKLDKQLSLSKVVLIGLWLFWPLVITVLLMGLFRNTLDWYNILGSLSIVILSLTLLCSFTVGVIVKVSGKLLDIGVNKWLFFATYLLLVPPLSQLVYDLEMHITGTVIPILFAVVLLVLNLSVVLIITYLLANQKFGDKFKLTLLVISLAICVTITYFHSLF